MITGTRVRVVKSDHYQENPELQTGACGTVLSIVTRELVLVKIDNFREPVRYHGWPYYLHELEVIIDE